MQNHAIPCNTMQYNAIPCNTMQYHASWITADGAYHCPVGSLMAIFSIWHKFTKINFGTTLERSAPISLVSHWCEVGGCSSKDWKSTCVDVLGGSLDGNRENLDSHNEKQRTANGHDDGIMFDGEFERIMFDDKRRVSSKPEEEEGAPQLAEFCRLCYCRLDFYHWSFTSFSQSSFPSHSLVGTSMDQHVEEEHLEDKEALLIEPSEENLAHFCPACPLRYRTGIFTWH